MKIIANVNIGQTITVQIANRNAQTIAQRTISNAHFFGFIFKTTTVIFVKNIARHLIFFRPRRNGTIAFCGMNGVPQNVTIQVAIAIVIEKSGLRTQARSRQTKPFSLVGKRGRRRAIVDKKPIFTRQTLVVRDVRHVNIELAIAIHVRHRDARFPPLSVSNARLFGDVFKFEITFIQIQFIRSLIGRKINIGQIITINVAHRHATAIVEIEVLNDVPIIRFGQFIFKINARLRRSNLFKKQILFVLFIGFTSKKYRKQGKKHNFFHRKAIF